MRGQVASWSFSRTRGSATSTHCPCCMPAWRTGSAWQSGMGTRSQVLTSFAVVPTDESPMGMPAPRVRLTSHLLRAGLLNARLMRPVLAARGRTGTSTGTSTRVALRETPRWPAAPSGTANSGSCAQGDGRTTWGLA